MGLLAKFTNWMPARSAAATPQPLIPVAELPAKERQIALERERFIAAVDNLAQRGVTKQEACTLVALNHRAEYPSLLTSGRGGKSQLTYDNYRNWVIKRRTAGSLANSYARGERPQKGDQLFWKTLWALYLNINRLPLAEAYRLAVQKTMHIIPGAEIPCLAQARYALTKIDKVAVVYARFGETAARNKFVDFIRRDWTDIAPGECVIGDSRTFDTRVRVWDDVANRWIAVRPTIAALLDARSWYLASYWITTEPVCADTLIDTLALYLVNTAGQPPAYAYFDNGKDYTAQGFSTPYTVDGHAHSIFAELGISCINSLPYNGRAKTVESFFKNMMLRFDKTMPDYLGSRPGERTPNADYFDRHPEELPSLEQFCQLFAAWLDKEHRRPKSGTIHAGKSPAEIWESRPARRAFTPEELRFAMLKPVAVRKVDRGPSVQWNRTVYYSDLLPAGQSVLVKLDRNDDSHVFCFTSDGRLICEARTRDRIKALALDDAEARKLIGEQLARQRRQLKEARTTVEKLSGGKYLASPIEVFRADPDAVLIASRDTSSSVKGLTHSVRHVGIAGVSFRADDPSEQRDKLIALQPSPVQPEEASAEDMTSFDHFMRHRQNDDADEE